MSLQDDIFDLEDHFAMLTSKKRDDITLCSLKELKGLKAAWARVLKSHADMELAETKTEPVMRAIGTIYRAFK
jgi:hypothetical protein